MTHATYFHHKINRLITLFLGMQMTLKRERSVSSVMPTQILLPKRGH